MFLQLQRDDLLPFNFGTPLFYVCKEKNGESQDGHIWNTIKDWDVLRCGLLIELNFLQLRTFFTS